MKTILGGELWFYFGHTNFEISIHYPSIFVEQGILKLRT